MADYGGAGAISLSHGGRDHLSHTSDDDSSEHSPRSVPTLSGSASGGGVIIGGGGGSSSKAKFASPLGELIISKKPRGRPPGSKNKPKPPIVITKDSESGMKPVILEISTGSDVVETIIQYARRRHVGISVLSGSGTVSNVTLRHPCGTQQAPSLLSLLHGPFSLLSLSGSFMESAGTCSALASSCSSTSSFGICLAGGQGQVFGGIVGGKVVAASIVVVVASTFLNPTFQRLPFHDDRKEGGCVGGGGSAANAVDYEADETKPCINHETYNITSASVASPTRIINCQITSSHDQVTPWGPPPCPPY